MSTIDKKDFSRIYELMSFDRGKTLYEMEKKWDNIIYEQAIAPGWPEKYMCVTKLPYAEYRKLPDNSYYYEDTKNKINYYNNGRKQIFKNNTSTYENYDCNSPEFKTNSGGKTVQSSQTNQTNQTTQGKTVREQIENSAKSESINKTWVEIKKEFGSNSSKEDNIKLYNAWFKGGWRPGKPVPNEYQTTTYKSKNLNVVTTTTTTPNVENKNLTDTNGDGKIDAEDLPADTESMKSKNGNEGGSNEGGKEGESGQKDYREFDITTSENSWATFYGK